MVRAISDSRLALRQLRGSPGYTTASAITLALAIGAATVMVSATQAVLLRPMPISAPEALVVAWGSNPSVTAGVIELSYLDVLDLGRENRATRAERPPVRRKVTTTDWVTYGIVIVVVSAVTLLASYLPERAGATDPLALLRRD